MLRFLTVVSAIAMIGAAPAPAHAAMEDYPSVKLQGLDKSTARTTTFEAKVGSTITYGPLFIRIQSCRKAPPIETPESAAFVQIWEVPPEAGKPDSQWVFSGWMFASSPALSAMDHPVYDIWVLDCSGREEPNEEAAASETDATTSQDDLAAPVTTDAETPVVDSEAQDQTPVNVDAAPTDSDAAGQPDPESTMPTTPAPGTPFDPAVDPDAPYSPATPPQNMPLPTPVPTPGGALPVDPDAPYVPAPLPGQGQVVPSPQPQTPVTPMPYDPDAPYSPTGRY